MNILTVKVKFLSNIVYGKHCEDFDDNISLPHRNVMLSTSLIDDHLILHL